jgi:peptidoglycan/xylan/chitin deacetylase (PgdA/CDA1 family)
VHVRNQAGTKGFSQVQAIGMLHGCNISVASVGSAPCETPCSRPPIRSMLVDARDTLFLFLTYHRVLAEASDQPEFYDVSTSRFEQQLEMLKTAGFKCVTADQLLKSEGPEAGSFVLSFDDGTKDHLEVVAPILKHHDCRATFFVPTAKLNGPKYLSDYGVKQLFSQGHAIELHSHEHRRMDRMSKADVANQMRISQQKIESLTAKKPELFAPPGGFMSAAVRETAAQFGVKLIRTMHWGYNRHLDLLNLQCIPINSRTSEKQFRNIMQFRNVSLGYALKQTAKSMLPGALYQKLRDKFYT